MNSPMKLLADNTCLLFRRVLIYPFQQQTKRTKKKNKKKNTHTHTHTQQQQQQKKKTQNKQKKKKKKHQETFINMRYKFNTECTFCMQT